MGQSTNFKEHIWAIDVFFIVAIEFEFIISTATWLTLNPTKGNTNKEEQGKGQPTYQKNQTCSDRFWI